MSEIRRGMVEVTRRMVDITPRMVDVMPRVVGPGSFIVSNRTGCVRKIVRVGDDWAEVDSYPGATDERNHVMGLRVKLGAIYENDGVARTDGWTVQRKQRRKA